MTWEKGNHSDFRNGGLIETVRASPFSLFFFDSRFNWVYLADTFLSDTIVQISFHFITWSTSASALFILIKPDKIRTRFQHAMVKQQCPPFLYFCQKEKKGTTISERFRKVTRRRGGGIRPLSLYRPVFKGTNRYAIGPVLCFYDDDDETNEKCAVLLELKKKNSVKETGGFGFGS